MSAKSDKAGSRIKAIHLKQSTKAKSRAKRTANYNSQGSAGTPF